jgi:hypothetical protein
VEKASQNTSLPTSPTVNYLAKLRKKKKKKKENKLGKHDLGSS